MLSPQSLGAASEEIVRSCCGKKKCQFSCGFGESNTWGTGHSEVPV